MRKRHLPVLRILFNERPYARYFEITLDTIKKKLRKGLDEKVGIMATIVKCPSCHRECLALEQYYSMMVLSADQALFSFKCPSCGKTVSLIEKIPPSLYSEVETVAREVNAGMGKAPN